jgi:hypothetical protein
VFAGVLILYTLSVYLYWKFFWKTAGESRNSLPAPAD